jgi:hypothetical protein
MTSRQKAEEQASLVLVYGRLFGYDSEWVSGAQLLTQFYEEVAREQDRQASLHLELAGRRPSSQWVYWLCEQVRTHPCGENLLEFSATI